MKPGDHHLSIPRSDKLVDRSFGLAIGTKVAVLIATPAFTATSIACLWRATHAGSAVEAILPSAIVLLLAPFLFHSFQTAIRLWDRLEVSNTGLSVHRPSGKVVSVSWKQISEIRRRPVLRCFDLHCRRMEEAIRIQEQVQDFGELLTIIAERTLHLIGDDPLVPTAERSASRFQWRDRKPLAIGRDSVAIGGDNLVYEEVARIEFRQLGPRPRLKLALLVTTIHGEPFVVPLRGEDPVATYQRLRRAQLEYLVRHQLALPEASPTPAAGTAGTRWRMAAGIVATLVLIAILVFARNSDFVQRFSQAGDSRVSQRAWGLFRAGRYEEVVELGGARLEGRAVDERTLNIAMFRAISLRRLGRKEEAIRGFEAALPAVRALDSVRAGRVGELLYDLAELYAERGDIQRALDAVQEGLRIRPQSATHQLLAAYWTELLGDRDAAQTRYGEILPTLAPGSEGQVVAEKRLAALAGRDPDEGAGFVQREQVVHLSQRIVLVPINERDDRVDLADACLLIESKLELPCQVSAPIEIPEERIVEGGRTLYHAGRIASLLYQARRPDSENAFLVGVTTHDMYSGDANFLFSSQYAGWKVAVVSSYRLTERLPGYWDADVLATRRVVIQLLSAIGNGFGLTRPTSAYCPLAYPDSVEAFMKKSHRLCESTRAQWRNVLKVAHDRLERFDDVRLAELARVQRRYLMEPAL